MSRSRGTGSLYRKPGCYTWTIQYYVEGRCYREASNTRDRARAQQLLNRRLGQAATGVAGTAEGRPVKVQELWDALLLDCRNNGRKRAVRDLGTRWLHLGPAFAQAQARKITTARVAAYIRQRQEEGAANATINRETGALKRAFTLAMRATPPRVQAVPYCTHLREDNTRLGFIEHAEYLRLTEHAGELWLRAFLELGWTYGWRLTELINLQVKNVDLAAGTIRLDPGTTKNREGRQVSMTARVRELLAACVQGKQPYHFVFTRANGRPVKDVRRGWQRMTQAAGLPGLLVHDLRRSAAKAARAAGVPESVVMQMGGWKTAAMFRRYAIVSTADGLQAVQLLEAARARVTATSTATSVQTAALAAMPAPTGKVQ
jgi:integrase